MFKLSLIIIYCCAFSLFGKTSNKIEQNVLICGVCRDVQQQLPFTIKIVEELGNYFKNYRAIIYENNSIDKTKEILSKWAVKNRSVYLMSEDVSDSALKEEIINYYDDGKYFRPELIARARNIVLEKAMSSEFENYDFLIWIDMDFKIRPSTENAIKEIFSTTREWDAVVAYGIDPTNTYWDWYALRDANNPIGSDLLGNYWWPIKRHLSLHPDDDWYPVYSAFGGCGIYRKSSIVGCKYSAIVTEDLELAMEDLINKGKTTGHPHILKYCSDLETLSHSIIINTPMVDLLPIRDETIGIKISDRPNSLTWKMNTFVYQYPSLLRACPFSCINDRKG